MSSWAMRNPDASYADWTEYCEERAEHERKEQRDAALEAVLEAQARCRHQLADLVEGRVRFYEPQRDPE